ncbi:hypothetical protein KFE25_007842 [Diacronema lutheri]|uniref:Uncharacterized protein n=2 Tax=Diacronema lutheri TaxID=2081491 RepID=A0A8J5Y0Z4_DIALT|nr:hypothetical protein KFE25_007842 [Diacronema lutheri]
MHDGDAESGPEALRRFVSEVAGLREVAGSSIGPLGRLKIVRGGADGSLVLVTSSSQRLLGGANAQSPFARLLLDLCRAQRGRGGDGGLLTLALAASLIVDGFALGMGRHALCATLERCVSICHDEMFDARWPLAAHMHWRDLALPTALARSVVGAKRATLLSAHELEHVSALVVDAFVRTHDGAAGAAGALQCVRTQAVVGASPMRSHAVDGVLMDVRPPSGCPDALPDGALLALFEIVLDGSPPPDDGRTPVKVQYEYNEGRAAGGAEGAALTDEAERDGASRRAPVHRGGAQAEGARLALAALVAWLCARHVGVVASQRVISKRLQAMLLAARIVPLERLSLRHMDAVRRVSGARVLGGISTHALCEDALGAVGELSVRRVGSQSLTLLTRARRVPHDARASVARAAPVVTLVLCGRTAGALEELTAAVSTAQNALAAAARDPRVCPGGGATEWRLARRVRDEAAAWRRAATHPIGLGARQADVQAASDVFARALEAVPLAMACALGEGGAGAGSARALGRRSEERDASGDIDAVGYAGCDAARGRVSCVMRAVRVSGDGPGDPGFVEASAAVVVDLAAAKMHALASAVHVACVLLKVDRAIDATSTGLSGCTS